MRTVSSNVTTEAARKARHRRYLVQLGFDPVLRLSTAGAVVWAGQSWAATGVQVDGSFTEPTGRREITVHLPVTDRAAVALVLGSSVVDRTVKVWEPFGSASPIDTEDAVLVFDGYVDRLASLADGDKFLSLECIGETVAVGFAPSKFIMPPEFNHLPAPGTRITWGGEEYVLESR